MGPRKTHSTDRGSINASYQKWLDNTEGEEYDDLIALSESRENLEDSFRCNLAFGTGGLRGVIGPGPNRMNRHTVAKATQGLAHWLNAHFSNPSVAIARDSRCGGEEFVRTAVEVFAGNNIASNVYPRIEPTPTLSFAVRELNCTAGICITASHNPAEYNGYKVYGEDGCQITIDTATQIQEAIDAVEVFDGIRRIPFDEAEEKGMVSWIDDAILDRYIDAIVAQSHGIDCSKLKVAYTALHGTGKEIMPRVLQRIGIEDLVIEATQSIPDGTFPTCPRPNPEEKEALSLGLKLADIHASDLLLATDPDADRLGIAVRHNDGYVPLSGNETGILLLDFICNMIEESGDSLHDRIAVTTIVSAPMADDLALQRGFQLRRTLTGFKFIGEQIGILDSKGAANRFLFGFEESYGFLSGTYVRDKDAMVAAMLICEAAAWYAQQGKDLVEAIEHLQERYGCHATSLISLSYPGAKGKKAIERIMASLSENPPVKIAGKALVELIDYRNGAPMPVIGPATDESPTLPRANVIELRYEGSCKIIVRPSGTEPKIKAYLSAAGHTPEAAKKSLDRLAEDANALFSAV